MKFKGHMALGTLFFAGYPYAAEYARKFSAEAYAVSGRFLAYYDATRGNPGEIPEFLLLFAMTLLGAYFPDLDLKLASFFGDRRGEKRYLYHRQITHSLALCLAALYFSAIFHNPYLFFFSLGWLSHLAGDMLTGSVPVLLWGKGYSFFSRIGLDRFVMFVDWRKRSAAFGKVAEFFDYLSVPLVVFAFYLLFLGHR